MNNTKLIHGDCITEMNNLINDGVKVDLVLTDPPYGTTACKWDTIIPFEDMWECINNISHNTTPICLFGTEPFSSNLRLSNIDEYRYDYVWNKEIGGGIFARKFQPLCDYELISVFYKQAGQYYPIMKKAKKNRSFKRNSCKSNVYGFENEAMDYNDTGLRFPKRIITYNSQKGECNNVNRKHPTQKPVELLEYLIKTYSNENDVVLDFTMGSGSTGVACQNTNRDFIGIELDESYFEIAKKRLNENSVQMKLL